MDTGTDKIRDVFPLIIRCGALFFCCFYLVVIKDFNERSKVVFMWGYCGAGIDKKKKGFTIVFVNP